MISKNKLLLVLSIISLQTQSRPRGLDYLSSNSRQTQNMYQELDYQLDYLPSNSGYTQNAYQPPAQLEYSDPAEYENPAQYDQEMSNYASGYSAGLDYIPSTSQVPLIIRNLKDSPTTVYVDGSDTIFQVKKKIQTAFGFYPASFDLQIPTNEFDQCHELNTSKRKTLKKFLKEGKKSKPSGHVHLKYSTLSDLKTLDELCILNKDKPTLFFSFNAKFKTPRDWALPIYLITKTGTKEISQVPVYPDKADSVLDIKKRILHATGIPVKQQVLVNKGRALQDGQFLSDLNILQNNIDEKIFVRWNDPIKEVAEKKEREKELQAAVLEKAKPTLQNARKLYAQIAVIKNPAQAVQVAKLVQERIDTLEKEVQEAKFTIKTNRRKNIEHLSKAVENTIAKQFDSPSAKITALFGATGKLVEEAEKMVGELQAN